MKLLILLLYFSFIFSTTLIVPTDYPNIQAGFEAAADGDTILVLDGTYSGEGNIGLDFLISDNRTLLLKSENGPNSCIIDCQNQNRFINTSDIHLTIDGFQIINGYADVGGAIISSYHCNISHCIFSNNYADHGGAIWLASNGGEIHHCIFIENHAEYNGGAIIAFLASTIISHCMFNNNTTPSGYGTILGVMFHTVPLFYNSILLGSISYSDINPALVNCIFPEDIFFNPTLMPDPLFVDADNNDFHLRVESPAINAGTRDLYNEPDYFPLDPDGTLPDIGVFPYFLELPGDANFDSIIDVLDIIQTVDVIMGETEPFNAQFWAMDLNEDEDIDVLDIVLMVEIILS